MEPVTAVAFFETASVTEDTPDFRRPQSGCEFVEPHISRIETAAGKNPGTQRLRIIRQFYPYPSRHDFGRIVKIRSLSLTASASIHHKRVLRTGRENRQGNGRHSHQESEIHISMN